MDFTNFSDRHSRMATLTYSNMTEWQNTYGDVQCRIKHIDVGFETGP